MPALTGLRGIASLWVLLYHLPFPNYIPIINQGYIGVDLFFILSGFILTYSNTKKLQKGLFCATNFYYNRIFRIYPLHLFTLTITVCLVIFVAGFKDLRGEHFYDLNTLVQNILLIQTWTDFSAGWNGPSWSLSAEILAYIFFPVCLYAFSQISPKKSLLCMILLLSLQVILYSFTSVEQMQHAGKTGTFRALIGFSVGMLLYNIYKNKWAKMAAFPLLLITLVTIHVPQLRIFVSFPLTAIILLCTKEHNLISNFLSKECIVYLGKISFSLYLVQWPLIELGYLISKNKIVPDYITWFFVVLSILLSSLFLHYYIEVPTHKLGRKSPISSLSSLKSST